MHWQFPNSSFIIWLCYKNVYHVLTFAPTTRGPWTIISYVKVFVLFQLSFIQQAPITRSLHPFQNSNETLVHGVRLMQSLIHIQLTCPMLPLQPFVLFHLHPGINLICCDGVTQSTSSCRGHCYVHYALLTLETTFYHIAIVWALGHKWNHDLAIDSKWCPVVPNSAYHRNELALIWYLVLPNNLNRG